MGFISNGTSIEYLTVFFSRKTWRYDKSFFFVFRVFYYFVKYFCFHFHMEKFWSSLRIECICRQCIHFINISFSVKKIFDFQFYSNVFKNIFWDLACCRDDLAVRIIMNKVALKYWTENKLFWTGIIFPGLMFIFDYLLSVKSIVENTVTSSIIDIISKGAECIKGRQAEIFTR